MLREFQEFISRGNVLDLAVAVIIGAALATLTSSLTGDVIMPIVGALFGGLDFSNYFLRIGAIPADFQGNATSYAELKRAGVAVIGWGQFLTVVLNFLMLAFVIFLLMRTANRIIGRRDEVEKAKSPSEVELLTEIRDELRKR